MRAAEASDRLRTLRKWAQRSWREWSVAIARRGEEKRVAMERADAHEKD